jgi:peptide/nickel transport system substrate-binding protein
MSNRVPRMANPLWICRQGKDRIKAMHDLFYSSDGKVLGGVLSRRKALRSMGLVAVAAGAASLLAACGGNASVTASTSSAGSAAATSSAAPTTSAAASTGASNTGSAAATTSSAATSSASAAATTASATSAATTSSSASALASVNMGKGQFNGGEPYQVPPTGHWNNYVTNNISMSIYDDLINPPFAKFLWASNGWVNILADSFKLEPPDKFIVTLKSGLKWSDGNPFTPKDVVTTFTVLRLMSGPVWNYLDSVQASGNDITFHMAKPASVVQRYVLEQHLYSDAVYGQYAQKADALFSAGKTVADTDVKTLIADFQKFRPDSNVASGPFMYDKSLLTEAQLTLSRNPNGYQSKVQFGKIVIYNGETPTITPLVLAGQIDYATHGFPPATVSAFKQQGLRILTPPAHSGASLYINYAKIKGAAKKEVRQAIAYLVDRPANATFALGVAAVAQKYMTGLSDTILPLWVDASDIGKFNQYAKDTAKATSLLQGAGWKKGNDGVWVDDTGAKWNYNLLVASDYADWLGGANNLAEQLSAFGLHTTVQAVNHVQSGQQTLQGNFTLAIGGWGAGSPYPEFSYDTDILEQVPPEDPLGPGNSFDLSQTTTSAGAVNFKDLVVASGAGLDPAPQKAAVTKMALAFNELLPIIPIWEKLGDNPVNEGKRVTGWPADGDPLYKNDYYQDSFVTIWIYDGTLKPV